MKKIIQIFAFLCFSVALLGQETTDRKIILGGSMNLSFEKNAISPHLSAAVPTFVSKSIHISSFVFNPYIAYQINPKTHLGLQFHISSARLKFPDDELFRTGKGVALMYRYNLNPEKKFSLFIDSAFGIVIENNKYYEMRNLLSTTSFHAVSLDLGGGVLYRMNDRLHAILRVDGLSGQAGKDKDDVIYYNLHSRFNFQNLNFGVEFQL